MSLMTNEIWKGWAPGWHVLADADNHYTYESKDT